ncbi:kinase-like domain-containing protein [Pavlovales sp. CCMP2436]|nr:kinase-like domain-containing protein [Pavlovales sp. CCMP2436]
MMQDLDFGRLQSLGSLVGQKLRDGLKTGSALLAHRPQIVTVGSLRLITTSLVAEGGYSFVYTARELGAGVEQGRMFALKKVLAQDPDTVEIGHAEIRLLETLPPHPHIIRYHGSAIESKGRDLTEIYLVLEYCPNGSLVDLVIPGKPQLPEAKLLSIFHSVCKAEETIQRFSTLMYRAPEMVNLYEGHEITEAVDVWALGCILYTLAFHRHPFDAGTELQILNASITFPASSPYPPEIHDLILYALQTDPLKRPTVFQLIEKVTARRATEFDDEVTRADKLQQPGRESEQQSASQRYRDPQAQQQRQPPQQQQHLPAWDAFGDDAAEPASHDGGLGGGLGGTADLLGMQNTFHQNSHHENSMPGNTIYDMPSGLMGTGSLQRMGLVAFGSSGLVTDPMHILPLSSPVRGGQLVSDAWGGGSVGERGGEGGFAAFGLSAGAALSSADARGMATFASTPVLQPPPRHVLSPSTGGLSADLLGLSNAALPASFGDLNIGSQLEAVRPLSRDEGYDAFQSAPQPPHVSSTEFGNLI